VVALLLTLIVGLISFKSTRAFKRWIERRKLAAPGRRARWIVGEYTGYFTLGAGAIAVVVAGAAAGAGAGAAAGAVAISFLIGLPIINAALDWPSWAASRWLMRRLRYDAERGGAWPAIILHVAVDIVLAVFFLATLTAVLAIAVQLLDDASVADWRSTEFFKNAERDPWGDGLFLTAMLLSTLVPTTIHVAAAFGALIVVPPPLRRLPMRFLEDTHPSLLERWVTAGYLTAWVMLALAAASAVLYGIVYGLSYHGQTLWTLIFTLADHLVEGI